MRALLFLLHAAVTTLKMAGDTITNALWGLNIYGVIMARLLFDATDLESFWCSTKQSYRKLSTQALSILVPFAKIYLCESGFFYLLHVKNMYQNHLNLSNHLGVALSNCVPRHKLIREAVRKRSLGLFLMNSQAWKCSKTAFFLLFCQ